MKRIFIAAVALSALPFYAYSWQVHQVEFKNLTNHAVTYTLSAPSQSIKVVSGALTGSIPGNGKSVTIGFEGYGAQMQKLASSQLGQGLIWYHLNFIDSAGDVLSGGIFNRNDASDMYYGTDGNTHGSLSSQNILVRDVRLPTDFVDLAVSPGGDVTVSGKTVQTSSKGYKLINEGVTQILPYGQDCSTSTSVPSWACASSGANQYTKTNGIYRIQFAYDISADDLSQHPPVIAPFEVIDSAGKVLGTIDRDYAFMYRVSPTEVKLEETFTYVVPYNGAAASNPAEKISIQGGYSDAAGMANGKGVSAGTFHNEGAPLSIDLTNLPDDGSGKLNDSGLTLSVRYDGVSGADHQSALQSEQLYFNGLNQSYVIPAICTNGTSSGQEYGCPSGTSYIDPGVTSDPSYVLYHHIVFIDKTPHRPQLNKAGDLVVSNLVADSGNAPSLYKISSALFETSYLESRYYQDPQQLFLGKSQSFAPDKLVTGVKMLAYPPAAGTDAPTVPDFISIRDNTSSLSSEATRDLDICYVYYDETSHQVEHDCLSEQDSGLNYGGGLGTKIIYAKPTEGRDLIQYDHLDGGNRQLVVHTPAISDGHDDYMKLSALLDPFNDLGDVYHATVLVNGWGVDNVQNCQSQNAAMCYAYEYTTENDTVLNTRNDYNSEYCGHFGIHLGTGADQWFPGQVDTAFNIQQCSSFDSSPVCGNWDNAIDPDTQKTYANADHFMSFPIKARQDYSNWGDAICVLPGWPLWGYWLTDNYPNRNDSNSYGGLLYQQPFLYYKNHRQSYTSANYNADLYSHHFGLENYGVNNLVPPYPMTLTTTNSVPSQPGYNRENRSCSYPNKTSGNVWQSTFYNSWCEYAEGTQKYSTTPQYYAVQLGVNPGETYVSGVRDVFGNPYGLNLCTGTKCTQET